MADEPSGSFKRRIARLIVAGRFVRANREVQRWNKDKDKKIRLFPDQLDQLEWAERLLRDYAAKTTGAGNRSSDDGEHEEGSNA